MMNQKTLNRILVVSIAYVAAQMMADVASLRIVSVAGFSVDAGTLVYPLTFTFRDMAHKIAGIQTARLLILLAALINVAMAIIFWIAGKLPADLAVGPQLEFVALLSPVWRIVVASICAEVVSEFVDGEIYQKWVNHFAGTYQWGRVLSSNAIAIPIDSLIFCAIAFVGIMPIAVVFSIFWANIVVKGLTTLLTLPLIYTVKHDPQIVADLAS